MKMLLLIIALIAAACTPVATAPDAQPVTTGSVAGVRFAVEKVSTGTIRLTLDNGAPHAIGYNLCSSELQSRSGAEWRPVPSEEMCTMQLLTLNPGHDATFEKRMPAGLPAGDYRYVTRVESPLGTPATRLATEPFQH
ncbi:MAG: hypothetical protein WA208_13445 [Thermoanaerobaculia bacterium]